MASPIDNVLAQCGACSFPVASGSIPLHDTRELKRAKAELVHLRAESALLARIIAMWRAVAAEGVLLPEERKILAEYEALR